MTREAVERPERLVFVPGSHLDLYWLGSYRTCLDRGAHIIKSYLDRCLTHRDETFMIESVVFAAEFLHRHPEYREPLRELTAAGRVDISASYIDRWENLVLAESIARNVTIGKRWLADELGHDSRIALHPDLPGLNPQTPQLYRSAGVDFYASARKIFGTGRVWRAVAPDGTDLLMLRWPGHYNFVPLELADVAPDLPRWGDWTLDLTDLAERFPLGTVPVSGIAGDLTDADDFVARYGRPLDEFAVDYAARLPGTEVGYSTPTAVLTPYRDGAIEVARVRGGIPSVWGVSADESALFFQRSRRNEAALLAAETATVLGRSCGRPLLPPDASTWQGVFDEDAFFARKDFVDPARGFGDLWRLHLFTQDHNGGGQEGTLSSFQKRVRQERLAGYLDETIRHALAPRADGDTVSVLNPTTSTGPAHLVVDSDHPAYPTLDGRPAATGVWRSSDPLGRPRLHLDLAAVPSVGCRVVEAADLLGASRDEVRIDERSGAVVVGNELVSCTLEHASGRITVHDLRADAQVAVVGELRAVPEVGNDVTLQTDEAAAQVAKVSSWKALRCGPAVQLRTTLRLLDVEWFVVVTVRPATADVQVEIGTRWPGTRGWQVRATLAEGLQSADVAFGTPYHRTRWTDVPQAATPAVRDEIAVEDFRSYREIQHWLQIEHPDTTTVIATENPGLHLDHARLSAVLLRTAPSCGDPRFHWDNHGEHVFAFTLHSHGRTDDPPHAATLADRFARPAHLLPGRVQPLELLSAQGSPLHVGALLADGADVHLRLVNMSDEAASTELSGAVLAGGAVIATELDGRVLEGVVRRCGADSIRVELPAWRVTTVVIADRLDPPVPPAESEHR